MIISLHVSTSILLRSSFYNFKATCWSTGYVLELNASPAAADIIISTKLTMQNRQYQEFRDEQETEMQNYQNAIPVGQPVNPNAYPQVPAHHPPPFPHYHPPYQQQHPVPPQAFLPPPPPAFPPMAPAVNGQNFSYPVQLNCPCCKMNVPTVVNQESGNTTFLWCAFIGCCVTPVCCCVPFLMDSCLDKTHYCPNCGHAILRKHQRCFQFIGC